MIDLLEEPASPPPGGWTDLEAFGARDEHGNVFVIGYEGEWFWPIRPSLRVRLHNWLVNRREDT